MSNPISVIINNEKNEIAIFLLCGLLNVLDQFICGSLYGSEWENVFFVFYVFYVFFCSKTKKIWAGFDVFCDGNKHVKSPCP